MPACPGDIISYLEMCQEWGTSFQAGMNFRVRPDHSVLLMSRRPNAPYKDRVEDHGRILIYEGHDARRRVDGLDPKMIDQPRAYPGGSLTQNGLFEQAALSYKNRQQSPELVSVYEKIHSGIWAFNGNFELVDAWLEHDGHRNVFKFRLNISDGTPAAMAAQLDELDHDRLIPSSVKLEVWKRDQGKCVKCGSDKNLHFDHDIPYSKGGSSSDPANIRILCARHNLQKRDNIE